MRSQNGVQVTDCCWNLPILVAKTPFQMRQIPASNLSFLYRMNTGEFGGPNSPGLPSSVARWDLGLEQLLQDVLSYLNGMPDNGSGT
jgi:hypothetical protein